MSKAKCTQCRKDKAKCTPFPRALPQKCDRCIRFDHPCSENLTTKEASIKASTPPEITRGTELIFATDAAYLQELGDLRNIMESIAYLRRPFTWATYCNFDPHVQEVILTRLDNLVTVIAGRARSLLKAGFIIQAEYLLKTLRTRNTENVREIEAACECLRQTSSGSIAYDDDQIYLRSMVGLHEQLGDFPRAEYETELLIASLNQTWSRSNRHDIINPDLESLQQNLRKLNTSALERASRYHIIHLPKETSSMHIRLSQLLRVSKLKSPDLLMEFWEEDTLISFTEVLSHFTYILLSPGALFSDLLAYAGFDINTRGLYGDTTLHLAVQRGRVGVVNLLLEAGASVNIPSLIGQSPLHWAVQRKETEILKRLLDVGAPMEFKDENRRTPLHYACCHTNIESIRLLLDAHADINAINCHGMTPLHLAAAYGDVEILLLLLRHGANLNIRDNKSETCLHSLMSNDLDEEEMIMAIENFKEAGAKLFANGVGKTPIHVAYEIARKNPKSKNYWERIIGALKEIPLED